MLLKLVYWMFVSGAVLIFISLLLAFYCLLTGRL